MMYLAVCTHPDIAFAVSSHAKFTSNPNKDHWTDLKRLFRYLQGTQQWGIQYTRDGADIKSFTDADWAGDLSECRSTSGYIFMLQGSPISWKSQKQRCVALSTAEAEYIAMTSAAQELIWLQQLIGELTNSELS